MFIVYPLITILVFVLAFFCFQGKWTYLHRQIIIVKESEKTIPFWISRFLGGIAFSAAGVQILVLSLFELDSFK